jgi:hypothetical protein
MSTNKAIEISNKIDQLDKLKAQTQSSFITLVIPPKYCI